MTARPSAFVDPTFFLHFDDGEVALEAASVLLSAGWRVEITPPHWEATQWDVFPAGVPDAVSEEEAAESLRAWAFSVGGSFSGWRSSDADVTDGGDAWT